MPAPPLSTGLQPGTRLGPYEVVAPLSAGGMATLYLGRRAGAAGFSRYVAIKVVHAHMARDPGFVSMFLDEARLAARIRHPNVVFTEELGEERGVHYIAMEYLRGCSLGQFLQKLAAERRGLSPELAAHIAMKVADGLHAAHELVGDDGTPLGVVHRDVSPQNVLLTYDGQVKLIDFGVAKIRGRDRGTLMGSLKGKIRYMSPEQASSQPVDRRTDVYALGIVLWECLTHQRLFSGGDDVEALERVKNPHVASPSALAPQIGPGLDECVMTALARDPERRFQTALAFRRAIGAGCPKALEVDAESLAALLVEVMHEDIERERREVPALAESAVVERPRAERTRGGRALTRETPVVREAAVRASLSPGSAPVGASSLPGRGAPVAAARRGPLGGWPPAAIAGVAVGATALGVLFAWGIASQLGGGAGAGAAPAPITSAESAAPGPAAPVMAPSAAGSAAPLPTGVDPPPELDVPLIAEGDLAADLDEEEDGDDEGHRRGERHGSRRGAARAASGAAGPGGYPAPPPPYRTGEPGGYPGDPHAAPPPVYRDPYRAPPPAYGPGPGVGPGPGPGVGPGPGPGPGIGPGGGRYDERPPPPDFRGSDPLPPPRGPAPGPGGAPPPVGRSNN